MLFKRPVIEYGDKLVVAWEWRESIRRFFYKSSCYFIASFRVSAIINDNSKALIAFNLGSHEYDIYFKLAFV